MLSHPTFHIPHLTHVTTRDAYFQTSRFSIQSAVNLPCHAEELVIDPLPPAEPGWMGFTEALERVPGANDGGSPGMGG